MPHILLEALKAVAVAVAMFVIDHLSKAKLPADDKTST